MLRASTIHHPMRSSGLVAHLHATKSSVRFGHPLVNRCNLRCRTPLGIRIGKTWWHDHLWNPNLCRSLLIIRTHELSHHFAIAHSLEHIVSTMSKCLQVLWSWLLRRCLTLNLKVTIFHALSAPFRLGPLGCRPWLASVLEQWIPNTILSMLT